MDAVARLTRYLDAVDESHKFPFQKSVSYMDQDAGTFAWEVFKVADLLALLTAYATVQAERDAAMADAFDSAQKMGALHIELATLRETLVGEVEARLHEKRMSFEMSGPHEDVDYRATFSFDEGGSWVRWPEIAAILNAIKGTP